MKPLTIIGLSILSPLLLMVALAGMAMVVFAVSMSPILLVLGALGVAAYELQQAFCESCRSRRQADPIVRRGESKAPRLPELLGKIATR